MANEEGIEPFDPEEKVDEPRRLLATEEHAVAVRGAVLIEPAERERGTGGAGDDSFRISV